MTKNYDYTEDVNRDDCEHKRTKTHEIKDEWEKDLVDVTLECEVCHRVGLVKARLDYDEEEVNWNYEETGETIQERPPSVLY